MQAVSSSKQMAKIAIQSSISHENKTYNATNADAFSWAEMWPFLADYFSLEIQLNANFCVQDFFENNENVWQNMTQKYALQNTNIKTLLVNTDILDKVTLASWHSVFGIGKSINAGFQLTANSDQLFVEVFKELKQLRIIP